MRASVARDLSDSAFDMQHHVWPAIASWCGGGEFYPVESTAESLLTKDLDVYAGIDGFQKRFKQGVIRGIASRVQWMEGRWEGHAPWNTFSLRNARSSGRDTEILKRLWQLAHRHEGYLYPHITVQAYMTKRRVGDLLSVAMAYTHELIPFAYKTFASLESWRRTIAYNKSGVWEKEAKDDNGSWAKFLCVDWDKYEEAGYFIKQWHHKDQTVLGEPESQFLDWVEEMEATHE